MIAVIIILGVVLVGVGIFALRPKLDVSKFDDIGRPKPFTIPFKVSNKGLLEIHDVSIKCYLNHVRVGREIITSSSIRDKKLHTNVLGRGESLTVLCRMANAPLLGRKSKVDLVIDFKVKGIPFKIFRRVLRFSMT